MRSSSTTYCHAQYLPTDLALLSIDAADDPVVDHPVLATLGLAALIGRWNVRPSVLPLVDSVGKPFSWLIGMQNTDLTRIRC